jgi:hypothetical protein
MEFDLVYLIDIVAELKINSRSRLLLKGIAFPASRWTVHGSLTLEVDQNSHLFVEVWLSMPWVRAMAHDASRDDRLLYM